MIDRLLKQSGYRSAVSLEKVFPAYLAGAWLIMTLILAFISAAAAAITANELLVRLAEIIVALFLLALVYWRFQSHLKRDKNFTIDEAKRFWEAGEAGRLLTYFVTRTLMQSCDEDKFYPKKFFRFLLKESRFVWLLKRLGVAHKNFQGKIEELYREENYLALEDVMKTAWQKALASNHLDIRYHDILVALFSLDETFKKIAFDFEVEEDDISAVAFWQRKDEEHLAKVKSFLSRESLLDMKGIGKDWSGGFTVNLDVIATDLTRLVDLRGVPEHLYGQRGNVELLSRLLVGQPSNVVMVGNPGSGRHTILRAFAESVNSGRIFGPLRYKRMLLIDSSSVLLGTSSLSEVLGRINLLFGEAMRAENVILVVDNIDAFLEESQEAGRVNATEALLPFFQSGLNIIGITSPTGYQRTIGKNAVLQKLFNKLEVTEPSERETLLILQDEVEKVERRSGLFFTLKSLQEIVVLTGKLIQNLPNPEKSLEVLEETAIFVRTQTRDTLVLPEHVQKVVEARTKVPVGRVKDQEKNTLLNLEEILHERIIGQDEAIRQIADALRRARAGIRSEKKPIGSFLFLGPTGVGKTETTKALASVYFGSESRIIRFDMSEFQEIHSIARLIGNPDTNEGGLLTEAVLANPFSLILLDEVEKAHPQILDLFLQVLDEGRLTDSNGRVVSFINTMLIMTSNAGAELIREMIKSGENPAERKVHLLDFLQKEGLFRPEFLNRFDAVVIFRPLERAELNEVAVLLLRELNLRLKEKDIEIKITPELTSAIVEGGYSPEFGARPLRRFIQENIENYIARALIEGSVKRGQLIEIQPDALEAARNF